MKKVLFWSVLLVFGGYAFLKKASDHTVEIELPQSENPEKIEPPKIPEIQEEPELENKQLSQDLTMEDYHITINWLAERGLPEENSVYSTYKIVDLREMAKVGDIYAQAELANKLLFSLGALNNEAVRNKGINETKYWYNESIISGNSFVINNLQSMYEFDFRDEKRNIFGADDTPYGPDVESLAWSKVGIMRNDVEAMRRAKNNTFFSSFSDGKKELSEKRAAQIYNALEQKRIEGGLGKFNNEIPEAVLKVYGLKK